MDRVSMDRLLRALADLYEKMAKESKPLEPESARILYENLWDMYDDGEEPADG